MSCFVHANNSASAHLEILRCFETLEPEIITITVAIVAQDSDNAQHAI